MLPLACPSSTWGTPSWAVASWVCPMLWPTLALPSLCKYQKLQQQWVHSTGTAALLFHNPAKAGVVLSAASRSQVRMYCLFTRQIFPPTLCAFCSSATLSFSLDTGVESLEFVSTVEVLAIICTENKTAESGEKKESSLQGNWWVFPLRASAGGVHNSCLSFLSPSQFSGCLVTSNQEVVDERCLRC